MTPNGWKSAREFGFISWPMTDRLLCHRWRPPVGVCAAEVEVKYGSTKKVISDLVKNRRMEGGREGGKEGRKEGGREGGREK